MGKSSWYCKSSGTSKCSEIVDVHKCDADPDCQVRPADGDKYFYCARVAECYLDAPNAKELEAIKDASSYTPDKLPIKTRPAGTFFDEKNCVATCSWDDVFKWCWPNDYHKAWSLMQKMSEADAITARAGKNYDMVQKALK